MSTEITCGVDVVPELVEVDSTPSGDTVTSYDHCIDVEIPESIVTGSKVEYSIVGDALYASVNTEDAPTWLVNLVDSVVTNQIAAGFVDYDNLAQDVQNAVASIDIASNNYVTKVQYDIDQAGIVNSVVTQLNATYDLAGIQATVTNLSTVIANENAAQGLTLANIAVNYEGYTDAQITTLNNTLSTAIGSNTSSINTLNTAYNDPDTGLLATANAVESLETYVGTLSAVYFALETAVNPGTAVYDYYYDPAPIDGTNLKRTSDGTTVLPVEGDQATIKVANVGSDDTYIRYFKGGVWVEGIPGGIVAGSKYAVDLDAYLGGNDGNGSWGGSTQLVSTIETTSKGEIQAAFEYNAELISKAGDYYVSGFGLNTGTPTGGDGTQGNPFTSEFWVQADTFRVTSPGNADFEFVIDGVNNKVVMDAADIINLGAQTITTTTTGHIKGGQTAYATGTGYFLGYDAGAYKFSIGSPTDYMRWDGTNMTFSGDLSAAGGTFSGALSAATGTFSGSLSAATGTFSGSLTAGAVNAVNTINLAGQAVTIPVSAYSSGFASVFTSDVVIQTLVISSTGAPIFIAASAGIDPINISTDTFIFSIRRNGAIIWGEASASLSSIFGTDKSAISVTMSDTPGAGVHTYTLVARCDGHAQAYYRSLTAIETKR